MYNWQQKDWPNFTYQAHTVAEEDLEWVNLTGKSSGVLDVITTNERQESEISLLIKESMKNAEIEGEYISRIDLISSIKNRLGLEKPHRAIRDKRSEGMGELIVKARESFKKPLSQKMLFDWHKWLMKGSYGINAGQWRKHTEPMQVISGTIGREKVHFEAPPSENVQKEMNQFISWFNQSETEIKSPITRSALVHLYFESIHPFEDGNGRIGRILAEKTLSQYLGKPALMSISAAIEADKKQYYNALKKAQKGNPIDHWIKYWAQIILKAQEDFFLGIKLSVKKTRFFDMHKGDLNARQLKVVRKMMETDGEFEGGMNARKYQSITKTSKATATRDLQYLAEKGILQISGGGRSTRYDLNLD
ncbi:Fic family protein [Jiulongibacter sp. NS-SX5]|uniref:Fic family protein n=1 Tax=Jiulongibacter sp. NS-SX5 TaxID=3463854 RepID=UPI0040584D57